MLQESNLLFRPAYCPLLPRVLVADRTALNASERDSHALVGKLISPLSALQCSRSNISLRLIVCARIRTRAMPSLVRPTTIGLLVLLSICTITQARTVSAARRVRTRQTRVCSLQAKNDNSAPDQRGRRQHDQYPQAPSDQSTPNEFPDTYVQGSECKGCGPRRDCQCPGKGAMGITGAFVSSRAHR